jgi:hypothetical protein
MTLNELKVALKSPDHLKRKEALRAFRDGTFGLEALPLLRRLLTERDDVQLILYAIECIGKLGPEALTCPAGQKLIDSGRGGEPVDLAWQLYVLGGRVWGYSLFANCYSACLDALVKLQPDEDGLLEYIHMHIGLSDDDFLESLKALKTIDTPEARDLAKRAVAFWRPELDKTHTKQLEKILATK